MRDSSKDSKHSTAQQLAGPEYRVDVGLLGAGKWRKPKAYKQTAPGKGWSPKVTSPDLANDGAGPGDLLCSCSPAGLLFGELADNALKQF